MQKDIEMNLRHPDYAPYKKFVRRQIVDKSIHTLRGILEGISIDSEINKNELTEVYKWTQEYRNYIKVHPFNEIIPVIENLYKNKNLDSDPYQDLLWLCKNISTESTFYDAITNDIQVLHGLMHGILADGEITVDELNALSDWIDDHIHLKGVYPYDEIETLIVSVLQDGVITEEESKLLTDFFNDFINYSLKGKLKETKINSNTKIATNTSIMGICATCPEISFENKNFVLTGTSKRYTRKKIVQIIEDLGGRCNSRVTSVCNYLVIGSSVNPCWAYSCYGRKVEQVIELRKESRNILIVHENDFWDSILDLGLNV